MIPRALCRNGSSWLGISATIELSSTHLIIRQIEHANRYSAQTAIETSLSVTGLEYVDLYLIHSPYGGREGRCGAWKALVEAQKVSCQALDVSFDRRTNALSQAGQIRSIGVSNYGVHHLDELEEYIQSSGIGGNIDVGQWELHPWLPHNDIVDWARSRGVVIEAWSPLGETTKT